MIIVSPFAKARMRPPCKNGTLFSINFIYSVKYSIQSGARPLFPLNALLLLRLPSVFTFRTLFELLEFGVRSHQFQADPAFQSAPLLKRDASDDIHAFVLFFTSTTRAVQCETPATWISNSSTAISIIVRSDLHAAYASF